MIQPSICGEWEKKSEKYGHVNKLLKSISVYKRKKRKIIDTTKIRVDIELERKKLVGKEFKWENHTGLVENRVRPRIGGQIDHLCS